MHRANGDAGRVVRASVRVDVDLCGASNNRTGGAFRETCAAECTGIEYLIRHGFSLFQIGYEGFDPLTREACA